jgi:ribosomal protein S18 acetylase RimI-like enzyme
MPDLLQPIAFAPELLDEVQQFECGDEPYQKELAVWLFQDAVTALERGTKVWLYANQANAIVGFGSLGLTRWKYPDAGSPKTGLVIIPAVAVGRAFWGKPKGMPEDRCSSQIMRHLVAEALAWPGSLPALGLFVHPDNQAAIKLYSRFGFSQFHHVYTDPTTGVTYQSMVRTLACG